MEFKRKLSIVYSFKNEENNITELFERTSASIQECLKLNLINDYEIIFIDDASTDTSFELLKSYKVKESKLKVFRTTRSFGNAECLRYGINQSDGDYIVYLDSDLQDPPELIIEMLIKLVKSDVDVIYTRRTSRKGESLIKLLITWVGYRFLSAISSYPLLKDVGDFTLIRKRVANNVKESNEKLPYTRGLIQYFGFPYSIVEYDRDERSDGQHNSKFPLLSVRVWHQYFDRALLSTTDFPLKILFPIAIIMFFIVLCLLFHVSIQLANGSAIAGWSSIMITVLITSSLNFLALALISLYINNTYLNSRNRKDIIIRQVLD